MYIQGAYIHIVLSTQIHIDIFLIYIYIYIHIHMHIHKHKYIYVYIYVYLYCDSVFHPFPPGAASNLPRGRKVKNAKVAEATRFSGM
jgi:hypothetical protein